MSLIQRRAILAGAALAACAAHAEGPPGLARVVLRTAKGAITLDLDVGRAPITARNFLRYVDMRLWDRTSFYRASHAPDTLAYGLIQAGLRGAPAKVLKPIAHESTATTGLTHKDGTISMARGKPGTAAADFFICIGDHPGFDAGPDAPGDKQGFAAFGQVVDGMDVVRDILASPTSTRAGAGAMRGEMLSPPIVILSARRST
jgi:peptidyl-prolyl cis-trans isomerase A (cyclophilin A)